MIYDIVSNNKQTSKMQILQTSNASSHKKWSLIEKYLKDIQAILSIIKNLHIQLGFGTIPNIGFGIPCSVGLVQVGNTSPFGYYGYVLLK